LEAAGLFGKLSDVPLVLRKRQPWLILPVPFSPFPESFHQSLWARQGQTPARRLTSLHIDHIISHLFCLVAAVL
jgi:hypothetical protein